MRMSRWTHHNRITVVTWLADRSPWSDRPSSSSTSHKSGEQRSSLSLSWDPGCCLFGGRERVEVCMGGGWRAQLSMFTNQLKSEKWMTSIKSLIWPRTRGLTLIPGGGIPLTSCYIWPFITRFDTRSMVPRRIFTLRIGSIHPPRAGPIAAVLGSGWGHADVHRSTVDHSLTDTHADDLSL